VESTSKAQQENSHLPLYNTPISLVCPNIKIGELFRKRRVSRLLRSFWKINIVHSLRPLFSIFIMNMNFCHTAFKLAGYLATRL
jgi:hypothetical protein